MFDGPGFTAFLAFQDTMLDGAFVRHLIAALAFAVLGLVFFAIAFYAMVKALPFSVRKEIEDDQNTALAIVMASVIIGIAIIIGMAVKG